MPINVILQDAEEKMKKTDEVVQHEFAGVRTGKASPSLVENIMVECYGSQMRIRDVAAITTPESRQLLIQPWDASTIQAIEKAIQASELGVNPSVDGKNIRVALPELSEERRQEYVKVVRKMAEDGRVAIRHVRREALDNLKKATKDEGIPEDDSKHAEKDIQTLTDKYVALIDEHLSKKEKEILKV